MTRKSATYDPLSAREEVFEDLTERIDYANSVMTPIEYGFVDCLDDVVLEAIEKSKIPVSVFLVSGIKLQGVISFHSDESIVMQNSSDMVIFKRSIATISLPTNGKNKIFMFADDNGGHEAHVKSDSWEGPSGNVTRNSLSPARR
jgi:RNA chaperone Hfq